MAKRLILIPPSEGKAPGGEPVPVGAPVSGAETTPFTLGEPPNGALARVTPATAGAIQTHRGEIAAALGTFLSSADAKAASKLLGAKGETLDRAIQADTDLYCSPRMPAIERYDGVLYQHLDHMSLNGWERRRLASSVLVVSGLWGLVAPEDLIPDYRLKMSASLPGVGRLSTLWKPVLTEAVEQVCAGAEIWNLLPQEHAAAVVMPERKLITTAVFLEPDSSGRLIAVSHWNKAHKGTMVRYLLQNPGAAPEDLLDWEHPGGFCLDPASIEPVGRLRALRFVAG